MKAKRLPTLTSPRIGISMIMVLCQIPFTASAISPSGSERFDELLQQARQLKQQQGKGPIVITVPPGTYTLDRPIRITTNDSGTKQRPIVYHVSDPKKTTFTSEQQLPSLRATPEGIWTCELPDGFKLDQLFVNGRRAPSSRLPQQGYFIMQGVHQKSITAGTNPKMPLKAEHTISLDKTTAKQLMQVDLSEARLIALHKWNCTLRIGLKFNPKNNTIISQGKGMAPWNPWKKGTRFFLENASGHPLHPGQWRLQGRTFTYAPLPDESLNNTFFQSPQLEKWIIIQGEKNKPVSHITFQNFTWQGTTLNLPNGMPASQAAGTIDAAIMLDHASEVHFKGNNISQVGRYAIWFRENCHRCSITKSKISDMGAGGIRIGNPHLRSHPPTSHITVDRTMIQKGGRLLPNAVGIWIGQSGNNRITHNSITDLYYTGISVGWTWGYGKSYALNNKILFNHIYNIGQGVLSDMGAVYCLGVSPGSEVSGNKIHDIESYGYGGWGLYTDEGATGIKMENNLVYRTKCGGFHQHYGKENIIRNNIFINGTQYQVQATRPEKHLSFEFSHNIIAFEKGTVYQGPFFKIQNKIDHNLIWSNDSEKLTAATSKLFAGKSWQAWQQSGRDQHSIIGNPQFSNPATDDYTPTHTALLKQIGFKPFNPNRAGVYGE